MGQIDFRLLRNKKSRPYIDAFVMSPFIYSLGSEVSTFLSMTLLR